MTGLCIIHTVEREGNRQTRKTECYTQRGRYRGGDTGRCRRLKRQKGKKQWRETYGEAEGKRQRG
jgi:hypothetical protein